jgi:hypothetical protein
VIRSSGADPKLAAEFIALNVEVMLSAATPATSLAPELATKRLELLKERVAPAQQVAAHRQPQQPEAEPSGPLEVVDVVLRLGRTGEWVKSSILFSCGAAFGTVL